MKQLFNTVRSYTVTALAALSLCVPTVNAAVLDIDTSGSTNILMGIDDINIGGIFYDVDFGDGVWHNIDGDFATAAPAPNNVTRATDFLLTSAQLEVGLTEIKSLLDASAFENAPTAINGCTSTTNQCTVHTPFGSFNATRYATERFRITPDDDADNVFISVGSGTGTFNNASIPFRPAPPGSATFAVWSTSVSAVPEPASYAMLLAGGLLMLALRKRQIS